MTRCAKLALFVVLFLAGGLLTLGLSRGGSRQEPRAASGLQADLLYLECLRASPAPGRGLAAPASASVLDLAVAQLGRAYRVGGTTPAGFDCSGFTSWVFGKAGVSLPRTSAGQSRSGREVAARGVRPGDLVFFGGKGGVGHVGISLSGDAFIHSSGPAGRVSVDSLSAPYWSASFLGARRVLGESGTSAARAAR